MNVFLVLVLAWFNFIIHRIFNIFLIFRNVFGILGIILYKDRLNYCDSQGKLPFFQTNKIEV